MRIRVRILPVLLSVACVAPTSSTLILTPLTAEPDDSDVRDPLLDGIAVGPSDTGDTGLDTGVPEDPCLPDAAGWLPTPEGAFLPWDTAFSADRRPCTGATHAFAGPAGATLEVSLDAFDGPAELVVEDVAGRVLAGPHRRHEGDVVALVLPHSGEVLLRLQPADPADLIEAEPAPYGLSVQCRSNCAQSYTRHPLVLMHGMAGDDAWVGVVDYFQGVENSLHDAGFAAFAPGVDAFGTIEARAAQWQDHLDDLQAAGLGRQFTLVGHSQGGLDARYLASVLEDNRVAAIVTIATPHHGTVVADLGLGILDGVPGMSWAVDAVIDLFASFWGLGSAEFTEQVRDLSTVSAAAFNTDVPDPAGLYIASWAGRTCARIDWSCRRDNENEVASAVFDLTTQVISAVEGDNDGLVSVDSATWGDFRGVLPADHLDQVGMSDPLATAPLDHHAFFIAEATRLAELGF